MGPGYHNYNSRKYTPPGSSKWQKKTADGKTIDGQIQCGATIARTRVPVMECTLQHYEPSSGSIFGRALTDGGEDPVHGSGEERPC